MVNTTTNTTATSGYGYFIDTTNNAHTINLPASPSAGDYVAIKDYAGTFATNNLTIVLIVQTFKVMQTIHPFQLT